MTKCELDISGFVSLGSRRRSGVDALLAPSIERRIYLNRLITGEAERLIQGRYIVALPTKKSRKIESGANPKRNRMHRTTFIGGIRIDEI
jgi:hypothetical protein